MNMVFWQPYREGCLALRAFPFAAALFLHLSFCASPACSAQLQGETLFVGLDSPARKQANLWRSSRPADAAVMDVLAQQAVAYWFDDPDEAIFESVHSVVH